MGGIEHRQVRFIASTPWSLPCALDGRLAGASYRAIAEALFDPSRITSEPWKTAPLRDTVIRLTRTGFAMMRGGYRNLLGPRRPD